jgi:hypothetical protein
MIWWTLGSEHFAASTWLPNRRKLASTFRAAGFLVNEHLTWLYRGTPHGERESRNANFAAAGSLYGSGLNARYVDLARPRP